MKRQTGLFSFKRATRLSAWALIGTLSAHAWAQDTSGSSAPASPASAKTHASSGATPVNARPAAWRTLGPGERQVLAPLAASWDSLSAGQQRKWQEIARNFSALPASEQEKMQQRMRQWAALSPQERAQARLNFGKTVEIARELTAAEKLAKWQAYQALPAEQRQKLADQAKVRPQGAAPAVQPVPAQKLAVLPPVSTAKAVRPAEAPAESADAAASSDTQ